MGSPNRINFIALSRSGHHAVGEWLLSQLPGTGVFIDCEHGHQPAKSAELHPSRNWEVWNYENIYTDDCLDFARQYPAAGIEHNVMLLRDFRNWLASCYARQCHMLQRRFTSDVVDGRWLLKNPVWQEAVEDAIARGVGVWIDHAEYEDDDVVRIIFHKWFLDEDGHLGHRADAARALGLEPKPWRNEKLVKGSGGSDIDERTEGHAFHYNGNTAALPVLRRYEQLAGDPVFALLMTRYAGMAEASKEVLGL